MADWSFVKVSRDSGEALLGSGAPPWLSFTAFAVDNFISSSTKTLQSLKNIITRLSPESPSPRGRRERKKKIEKTRGGRRSD